jgi:dipeptidyl aminopeptidase/acylaminoacyl peptidase
VAYLRSQVSVSDDSRTRQIWLVETAGSEPRRISWGDDRPRSLAWSPSGSLSFISSRGDAPQVWLNPLDGSEPRAITDLEQGVGAFWWSPDGTHLAVLAGVDDQEDEGEDNDEDETEEEGDWTVFDRIEQPDEFPQLWIVSVTETGPGEEEPRMLTSPPINAQQAAWSPDGTTIALTYNPRFSGLVDEDQRVALVDVASGEMTQISPDDRHASQASFSPDGRTLAYFMDREPDYRAYLNAKDVVVRDLESGEERALTTSNPLSMDGGRATPPLPAVWSADGSSLFVQVADGIGRDLYQLGVADGSFSPVTRLDGNLRSFSIAAGMLAYVESELHRPGSLWFRELGDETSRELDSTDESVAAYGLVAPRHVSLPGHDGVTVEGFLFMPVGHTDGPVPMITEMHGGPYSRYGNAWSGRYPWHVLAHNGFAVFIANPRGGTGYGIEFRRGVYRNFGTDDAKDILAAIDALVEQGVADPERLGFTGYSYGGLMTNVMISRTTRFKAAVSIAGMFNYVSGMGQSNPQLLIDSYDQPWSKDLQLLWEHSPVSRADRITTPTLVMHGEEDHPVDPRQSVELFTYLQLNGVPSRLVLYPREGHGINEPAHMVDYQTRELEWFRHYLLGDLEAAGAEDPVPVVPSEPGHVMEKWDRPIP